MRHTLTLTSVPFSRIKTGTKVIESRLYDEKRRRIAVGDEILFIERDNPEHTVLTRVLALYKYSTFEDLFSTHDSHMFGGESAEFLLQEIQQFYTTDDVAKYGVIGIHVILMK